MTDLRRKDQPKKPDTTMRRDEGSQPKTPRQLQSVLSEAKRLGVSPSWLYQEIRAHRFPHVRLGNRVLLDPADVDAFLARRCVSVEQALERAEGDDEQW